MQITPFRLMPEYRDYMWGGDRLRPGHSPTAEAWVVYENNLVADGAYAGRSLAKVAAQLEADLLGQRALATTGLRFPLLIKLLDCAQWLSLQVHPNDAQALALEGPGFFGKTEAWYVVEAAPGAEILCGLQSPVDQDTLRAAIREGKILEYLRRLPVSAGDTIFIPPGMLHALGPGLLIYEIQQTSDLTYRVWDWDRPADSGRKLHIEQSLMVIDPHVVAKAEAHLQAREAAIYCLAACEYFKLEMMMGRQCRFEADTQAESFHVLTVVQGLALVESGDWQGRIAKYETLVIPAGCRQYAVIPEPDAQILRASIPAKPGE